MTPLALRRWPIFGWSLLKALLPFPTPSVLALAGAAVIAPDARWSTVLARIVWRIAVPGAVGMTLGSVPYYAWARWRGRRTLERFLSKRRRWHSLAERCEAAVARRPIASTIAMRALPVVPLALGSLLIGLSGCSWLDFVLWTFVGAIVRAGLLAGSGHLARAMLASPYVPRGFMAWAAGAVLALAAVAISLRVSARSSARR